jgi:hypothetical protein
MKILPVLDSCEMRMEHQRSQQLRSETLLSLLITERENYKISYLANKNFTAIELGNDMDKNELRYELNYAIILLTDYQKTKTLSIALPSNAFSKDFSDKLNSIKDRIEAIIVKY